MVKFAVRCQALAAAVLLFTGAAVALDATPKVSEYLFDRPHIAPLAVGTELVYKFVRKPSDEKVLGAAFNDDIKLKIETDEGKEGRKTVLLQVYSGDRAREPQRITNMNGNPVLIVYLDNAVSHFRELAGGDSAYLKGTFSRYLSREATIAPASIVYKGQPVDGFVVTAHPYANDPSKAKMNGFENSQFTIALSEKIPGYLAKMVTTIESADKAAPSLVETTTLEGVGDVK